MAGRSSLFASLLLAAALAAPAIAQKAAAPAPVPEDFPARHREFLEEAAPLLSAKERDAFLGLRQEYQRDAFIRRFWEVRDPFPQTPGNELQQAWAERAKIARERFGGLSDERARLLLLNGPPLEVFPGRCSDVLVPLEIWSYAGTDRIKGAFNLVFYSPQGSIKGPYRLWYPTEGLMPMLGFKTRGRVTGLSLQALQDACPQGDEIAGRLAGAIDWGQVEPKVLPRVDEEWLAAFLSSSTDVPQGAATFPARLDLSFPSRFGSRTVVQGLVSVPRAEVKAATTGLTGAPLPIPAYSFLVDGEILREGELFDHFRYRFSLPAADGPAVPGAPADTLPLVFQRNLRPGLYDLVLKVEDTEGKRYYREQREIEVPSVAAALPPEPPAGALIAGPPTAPSGSPAAPAVPASALAEANAAIRSDENSIRILPPPQDLLTGRIRVDAMTTGEGIGKVRFELNGRPVLTKGKPPYSVELNLGDQPRSHRLRAVAIGAGGETLAEDELMLNAGPHRFSVRLIEPRRGKTYRQSVQAQAVVEVPEGEALDRVELYLNDTRLATLYQPPFVQPLLIPPGLQPGQDLAYVRAVAYLADGNSTEDLVMINRPDYSAEVDVQLVELYATVVDRKGRPAQDITRQDLTVTEDGAPQEILRFERVQDLPIYAGVMIDTSISMAEELKDATKGALEFFENVITPKDRAALVTFNQTPTLAVRFTNQPDVLAGSVEGLTAEGETAIYDSLIFTLHYFGGVKGKRAVILLTDGEDSRSKYPYNDALEYARRSGVALYTVGINLPSKMTDAHLKLERLAQETGGRAFFISRATELPRIYQIVEDELRSQYLIAYQSSKEGNDGKFRSVEVKVRRPGLEAKTVRGYYP
jgi:Ca-activated chloride channel family protein